MTDSTIRRVLVLCTGNSCRSQMAEAIINSRFGHAWQAFSAGTRPSGYVHPLAVRALAEIGIQFNGRSKHMDEFKSENFDLVITVCDSAAKECPVWPGQGERVHHSYPDPALATGSDDEKMPAFRAVRDAMAEDLRRILRVESASKEPGQAGN